VRGCPSVPLSAPYAGVLEYPGVPRMREYSITLGVLTQLSTVEHSLARADAGVFHRIVECSSVHAAAVAAVGYPKYGCALVSTLEGCSVCWSHVCIGAVPYRPTSAPGL
jgi:hypothetical protein